MKQMVEIFINNKPITTEVDTGCPIILIGAQLYRRYFANSRLEQAHRSLSDASGNKLEILGSFAATISSKKRSGTVTIFVQEGNRQIPLLGTSALDILFPA